MNILIADDERLVRLSLMSMIEEIDPNIHTFVQAKNGKELINFFNNNTFDIAFIDVNMPLMDGLSALNQCDYSSSNTQLYILTGEKEFDLIKKSVSMGVKDYILKPISLDVLKTIIYKTKSDKKNFLIKENSEFELDVISTYNRLITNNISKYTVSTVITSQVYTPYLFSIDGLNNVDDINILLKNNLDCIREFMYKKLNNELRFATYYIDSSNLVLIIKQPKNLYIDFSTLLDSLQGDNYSITLCKYLHFENLLDICKYVDKLVEYSTMRVLYNFKNLICIDEYFEKTRCNYLQFSKYIYNLTQHYIKKEELLYNEILNKMNNSSSINNIYNTLNKDCLNEYLTLTIGFNFDFTHDFYTFIKSLLEYSSTIFNKSSKLASDTLIDEIMNYVKLNYMYDIGVNTIASLYNITPNYLSKIFKEKSGFKFIDYITALRINESKKLLNNSSLSIKEISTKVGYHSSRHFSKQFLKLEGVNPSEFLKKNT